MSTRRQTTRRWTVRRPNSPTPDPAAVSTQATPPRSPVGAPPWPNRRLRALARRHGSTTGRQQDRLRDSIVRHINAGDVDLDDANAFLQTLRIGPVNGPGRVTFRVPVALAMIHEDVETDTGTFQYRVEESPMFWTRLAGYLGGIRVARPTRANIDTARRHSVVSADLLLSGTVPAYTTVHHLVALATAMLRDDLSRLREEVDLLDDPTVYDIAPLCPARRDETAVEAEADEGDGDGWDYHADEFDDDNYINYGLDTEPEETADEFDPATPLRGQGWVADEWTDAVFDAVVRRLGHNG